MAKGKATGLWTGKVGNNVFYKITNSNNAQKQGIRERVIEVSNPKTTAQAGQRYKMLPAQRIANALKEIIERGQQGVKYGALSRNEFMSRALKMTTGFPYMEKDNPNIIPGEYQLTKGTLPEVTVDSIGSNGRNVQYSLGYNDQAGSGLGDIADFSQCVLAANTWLQEGDQITIVLFALENGVIMSDYVSIILDTNNSEELPSGPCNSSLSYDEAKLMIEDTHALASAIIISRANGANGFLRSNATLAVNKTDNAIAKYFTAAGQSDALKTYEGDTSISNNTNWPVDVDGDGGTSGGGGSVERGLYTLTAADCEAGSSGPVGSRILVGTLNSVIKNIYYVMDDDTRCCCDLAGDVVNHNYGQETGVLPITLTNLSEAFLTGKNVVAY